LLAGHFRSEGIVKMLKGTHSGSGEVSYQNLLVDGYKIGQGKVGYRLKDKSVIMENLRLEYAQGTLSSKDLTIDLSGATKLYGNVRLDKVRLEGILDSLKEPDTAIRLPFDGNLKVNGTLEKPFKIDAEMD